jgi:gluconolactonase
MKSLGWWCILMAAGCVGCANERNLPVVEPGAVVVKLAGGFVFTEGPAADATGNVYFTDIPNNRIHQWSVDGVLSTVRENSGGANGLFFDRKGALIACEGGNRRLVSLDPQGRVTVLADQIEGKNLNSPNDLWIDPKGGIYFSDPRYGNREGMELKESVYYLSPDRTKLTRVIDDLVKPNGLIGTKDGRTLYAADRSNKPEDKNYAFDIRPDGMVANKRFFCPEGADGMTIDCEGNVYVTRDGVSVYNPAGKKIATIDVPEKPSNVCFGGKDRRTLFITARTSLYSIRMRVKGQ